MPQTRSQRIVFGLLMSLFMSIGMELYNNAWKMGMNLAPGGFSNISYAVVPEVARELVFIVPLVFVLSSTYGNRLGAALAYRLIDPERDSAFFRVVLVICCTTLVMCPSMSLFATVYFNIIRAGRALVELPIIWFGTLVKNFPMALLWNLFAASPMSRIVLQLLFSRSEVPPIKVMRPCG